MQSNDFAGQLKFVMKGFAALAITILFTLTTLVGLIVHGIQNKTSQDVHVEARQVASASTAANTAVEYRLRNQASINGAEFTLTDDGNVAPVDGRAECLRIYWQSNEALEEATPNSGPLRLTPDQEYSFNLAIQIDRSTAQNVRIYTRLPHTMQAGDASTIEVLVTADNAMPYYVSIDVIAASGLAVGYRTDSAVIYSNNQVDGTVLDAKALFADADGVLLGASQLDGVMPAGEENACVVSWIITVTEKDVQGSHLPESWLLEKYQASLAAAKP